MGKKKLRSIIIDDEQESIELIDNLLHDIEQVEVVATCTNVDDAITLILNHKPDILFLDIQMPGKTGFDLLNELKDFDISPYIIFVTAFDQYAIKAIHHSAFDYILKPVNKNNLQKSINRLSSQQTNLEFRKQIENFISGKYTHNKLKFNLRTGYILINPNELIYCKADGNYTDLFLSNGKTETTTINLGRIYSMLPENIFFRISRSTIINLIFLKKVDRKNNICILINGTETIQLHIPADHTKELEDLF